VNSDPPGNAADAAAGLRLALGTLTVLPVRVIRVDPAAARWTMPLAPLVGLVLGLLGAALFATLAALGLGPLRAAVAAVGALALLTRGLHWDGLADLADGLGSGREPAGALEVMRRSDIGPFGVLTLLFTVGLQVATLARLGEIGAAAAALGLLSAVVSGRLALTWACRRSVPAARGEGLGAMVAATVHPAVALGVTAAAAPLLGLLGAAVLGPAGPGLAGAVALGPAVSELLLRRARRRVGGVTGDVMGAVCESATTAALLAAAIILAPA
jgi:adenosylcobinamide-GDP ribazoletransferase